VRQQDRMVLLERAGTRRASWISRRGNARRSYLDAQTRGLQADGVEPGRDRASAVSRRGSHGVRILSVPEAALTSVEFLSALVVSEVSDAVGGPPGHGSSPKSGSRARRTWPSGHQFCTASRGPVACPRWRRPLSFTTKGLVRPLRRLVDGLSRGNDRTIARCTCGDPGSP